MLPPGKSKSDTVPEAGDNGVISRPFLAFVSGQKRIKTRVMRLKFQNTM